MSKLRITEKQAIMLSKEENKTPKRKVLKINEDQYSRIFKGKLNTSDKVQKNFDKSGVVEDKTKKELNLLEFAREIIVFIKDVISNPKSVPLSTYWKEVGINKGQLFRLLRKEGLLEELMSEAPEDQRFKSYSSKKVGFRKKIKELFKRFNSEGEQINELGGAGYPAGAEFDSNAPWNQSDTDSKDYVHGDETDPIKAEKEILKLVYYSENSDGLAIFKRDDDLFVIISYKIDGELLEPYEDIAGYPDGETINNFVNHRLGNGEMHLYQDVNALNSGDISLINKEVRDDLMKYYGDDIKLVDILNQLPESTTAASSGAYVGGGNFNGPIQKSVGKSPEEAMKALNEEMAINKWLVTYNLDDNGGDTSGFMNEFYEVQDFMNKLESEGIVNGVKVSKTNDKGVVKSFIYDFDGNDWNKRESIEESTTTVSVGGDSGTFAFDAPVGDGSSFWNAGNKQNKKMPVVKRQIGENEGSIFPQTDEYRTGFDLNAKENGEDATLFTEEENDRQVYLRLLQQWKLRNHNDKNTNKKTLKRLKVAAKKIGIDFLGEGKKILKITEEQLKKIIESDNATSTSYPNGEFVEFDDCVKFNNNTVAQDGGCSQGAVDGVAKYSKTKSSVVSNSTNSK
jgi:hypothetical protein